MKNIHLKIKKRLRSNLCLLCFLIIFFIVKLIIFNEIKSLYYVDVYKYIYYAIEIAETGNFSSYNSRGFPFVWFLSFIIKISSLFMNNPIFISKLTMLFINLFLYLTIYLTIKLIINQVCAFFSVIFLLIDPVYIEYSLIAYLEPFSLLMGWLAIYLILQFFKTNQRFFLFLSFLTSTIGGFTRFEMFLIFTLPILILFLIRGIILRGERKFTLLFIGGLIPLFVIFYPTFLDYYYNITRFDILTRIFMGLGNKDVVNNVFVSLSSITDETFFNSLFLTISSIGFIILIYYSVKKCYFKETFKSFSHILFALIIVSAMIFTISYYGYTYKIENGEVLIIPHIGTRYLMLSKSFIIPLFIYGIYKLFLTFNKFLLINYQKISKRVFIIINQFFFVKKIRSLKRKGYIPGKRMSSLKIKDFNIKFMSFGIISCLIFPVGFIITHQSWEKGIQKVNFGTRLMETFKEAGEWLENILEPDEIVFLPELYVFYVNSRALKANGLSYNYIWKYSGIIYIASTTNEDLIIVRNALIDIIKLDPKVKYFVLDWMDPIRFIFNLNVNDELYNLIYLTHEVKVKTGSYRPSVYIYEVF